MKFKESKYYNKEFLGQNLYDLISDDVEVFTVQEFFNINNVEKEYLKKEKNIDGKIYSFRLKTYNKYYELDCQEYNIYLFLVFDKPVHITGEYCDRIISPEIIIKNEKNNTVNYCLANKLIINNGYEYSYDISYSKINNLYFYNDGIFLNENEICNFFILNKYLFFDDDSYFLDYYKIKCFGECMDLKKEISKNEKFKKGIIHIE